MYSDADLNLRFLLGYPIDLNICTLYPAKIKDINDTGYDKYNQYLSILCVDSDDIYDMLDIEDESVVIEPYDYLVSCCINHEESKNLIINALKFFIHEHIEFYEHGFFAVGDISEERFIHKNNFNFIIEILKLQNCVEKEKPPISSNGKVNRSFLKRLRAARKKYNKGGNDISNLISSVCAKHPSINLFNIDKLTMYQLIDQYKRLNMIDEYFIGVDSLIHGASKEDVNLTHWTSSKAIN